MAKFQVTPLTPTIGAVVGGIALGYLVFALILALTQYVRGMSSEVAIRNWVADAGGVLAALSPVVVERFRRLFAPRPG